MSRTRFSLSRRSLSLAGAAALALSVVLPAPLASADADTQRRVPLTSITFTPDGTVILTSETVTVEGVYTPAFDRTVSGTGDVRFSGRSGPYNVTGTVGPARGQLTFNGPVGTGRATFRTVDGPTTQTQVRGNGNVQLAD
ncbi:hypothetical protein ACFCZ4_32795 [Streptomyces microflavus]|uniref:hypothetical protein n=1 Tax=Streptomyces microflavus TaxID=1919 RepID=UPI0035E3AC79